MTGHDARAMGISCPFAHIWAWHAWPPQRMIRLMNTRMLRLASATLLFFATSIRAQDSKSAEALEAQFKATMTEVTMAGRSCSLKDGVLGPDKEDQYHIVSVEKTGVDSWVVNARMQYGKREIVAPIPVKVKWAGDTAVMIIDQLQIPGPKGYAGTAYSARVLIHENSYAGTWSGGDHGGLLSGVIKKEAAK